MARLWVVYRDGLRLLGSVVGDVALETAITRLDIAQWRLFTVGPPDEVPGEQVTTADGRKRVLLEIADRDRGDLSGYDPGFYESPFSPAEALRRMGLTPTAQRATSPRSS